MSITLDGTSGITSPAIDVTTPITVADGGTGLTTPGTSGNALVSDGTTWSSGKQTITSGTSVSASGTSVDFTSIPSWVKRITVMFNGVSQNSATQTMIVQVGAGSITTSGYAGSVGWTGASTGGATQTAGFGVANAIGAANVYHGAMTITSVGSNVWVASASGGLSDSSFVYTGGGSITLGGTLDRLRITTVAGTATFDAGSINILYE